MFTWSKQTNKQNKATDWRKPSDRKSWCCWEKSSFRVVWQEEERWRRWRRGGALMCSHRRKRGWSFRVSITGSWKGVPWPCSWWKMTADASMATWNRSEREVRGLAVWCCHNNRVRLGLCTCPLSTPHILMRSRWTDSLKEVSQMLESSKEILVGLLTQFLQN